MLVMTTSMFTTMVRGRTGTVLGGRVLGRRVPGRRVMVMPAIMNIRVTTRVTTILTGTDIRTAS